MIAPKIYNINDNIIQESPRVPILALSIPSHQFRWEKPDSVFSYDVAIWSLTPNEPLRGESLGRHL